MKLLSTLLLSFCLSLTPFASDPHTPQPAKPSPKAGFHIYAHAHNDYEHTHPLLDALKNRFYSVEADIWLVDDKIMVSHDQGDYKGNLRELYLDPLQKRVREHQSVHDDSEPFYLWLDIKDARKELRPVLHNLLQEYQDMLTVFTKEKIKRNPVTVILTGDASSKRAYVKEYATRLACRDSNTYKADDPPADHKWRYYALNWNNEFEWNGEGTIPEKDYEKLLGIIEDIHNKDRQIRFYATPDKPSYWKLALQTGIDFINSDLLPDLNEFLEEYQEKK